MSQVNVHNDSKALSKSCDSESTSVVLPSRLVNRNISFIVRLTREVLVDLAS
jgi:hypothetical protein